MTASEGGRASYRNVLAVGEFRAILGSQTISMLGDVVASIALMVLVYQRTRSPALSASVMALTFLPYLVGGSLLGNLAERRPPRQVLVGCNLVSSVLVGIMAVPGIPVGVLLALLFVVNLFAPIFNGTRSATLPEVLVSPGAYILGRSMLRLIAQSAQVVGYSLGGLLLTVMTPTTALAGDAGSFAVSAVVLWAGTVARPARVLPTASLARDSLTGIRDVLAQRNVRRILLLSWLIPACAVAPEALATPYVVHLGEPARTAGYLLTGLPVGAVIGELIVGRALRPDTQRRLVIPAIVVVFLPLGAFIAKPDLASATGLLALSGLGFAYAVGQDAQLLRTVPPSLRTRALATSSAGLMFTQGVGFAVWGLAGEFASPRTIIPVAGLLGLVTLAALRPTGTEI